MSLVDPTQKMSKSHLNPKSRILITDTPEEVASKIMGAKTDNINSPTFDPESRVGVSNLLTLMSHFDEQKRTPQELAALHSSLDMKGFKLKVSDTISAALADIGKRYREILLRDEGRYIDHVAEKGASKARESANETMSIVKEAIGF